jgi:hypothetical protein
MTLRTISDVKLSGYDIKQKNCVTLGVTFGVTWGQQVFASESDGARVRSDTEPGAPGVKPMDAERQDHGFRGKFDRTCDPYHVKVCPAGASR